MASSPVGSWAAKPPAEMMPKKMPTNGQERQCFLYKCGSGSMLSPEHVTCTGDAKFDLPYIVVFPDLVTAGARVTQDQQAPV